MYILILWSLLCYTLNVQPADDNFVRRSLKKAQHELNYKFNYQIAAQLFAKTITLCQHLTPEDKETQASAFSGLAMCDHHTGQYSLRDQRLERAQKLIDLPEDLLDYKPKTYKQSAVNFFIVDGYRWSIYFENANKKAYPIEQQKAILLRAKDSFNKALTIDLLTEQINIETTHAHHGLGAVSELLSSCETSKIASRSHLIDAIRTFRLALYERQTLLGNNNPQVARTHHKLGRVYALIEEHQQAKHHYEEALAIYDACNIPVIHPKYQELLDDIIQ